MLAEKDLLLLKVKGNAKKICIVIDSRKFKHRSTHALLETDTVRKFLGFSSSYRALHTQ